MLFHNCLMSRRFGLANFWESLFLHLGVSRQWGIPRVAELTARICQKSLRFIFIFPVFCPKSFQKSHFKNKSPDCAFFHLHKWTRSINICCLVLSVYKSRFPPKLPAGSFHYRLNQNLWSFKIFRSSVLWDVFPRNGFWHYKIAKKRI